MTMGKLAVVFFVVALHGGACSDGQPGPVGGPRHPQPLAQEPTFRGDVLRPPHRPRQRRPPRDRLHRRGPGATSRAAVAGQAAGLRRRCQLRRGGGHRPEPDVRSGTGRHRLCSDQRLAQRSAVVREIQAFPVPRRGRLLRQRSVHHGRVRGKRLRQHPLLQHDPGGSKRICPRNRRRDL
uniref:Uncharacterized protein n=1 Tax=Oryza brachyantha TaxID=4533 RepID=J3KXN1_ORYBR